MKRSITARGVFFYGFVICLIILGVWLRTWQLGAVPAGITYDDLDYVSNGWSFAKTGKDLLSQTNWWQPEPLQTGAFTSELGPHWHMLTGLFDWENPVIGARLPSVMVGLLSTLLLGYLAWILFQKKNIFIFTTLFLLVTPWAVMISRSPIDASFGIFCLILGLVFVMKLSSSNSTKKIVVWFLMALVSFALAFYSYHAYKFTVVFTISWLLIYWVWQYLSHRNIRKRPLMAIFGLTIILTALATTFFFNAQKGAVGSRQQEIIFFNSDYLSSQVNNDRREAIGQGWTAIFLNKPIVIVEHLLGQTFKAINPEYLFLHSSDSSVANSFYDYGYLYATFFPLILIGLIWVWKYQKDEFWLLIGLIIASLLPAIIQSNFSSVLRAGMNFLFFVLFASTGFYVLVSSKSKIRNLFALVLGALILVQIVWFGHWYFWVYPIKLADAQNISDRVLAGYLTHVNNDQINTAIIADNPRSWYRTFAFYNKYFNRDSLKELQNLMQGKSLSEDMQGSLLLMSESCTATLSGKTIFIMSPELTDSCGSPNYQNSENQLVSVLSSPADNRAYFYIFNDQVCDDFSGVPFVNIKNHSQLQPEKMSREEFCQTWVRKEVK